VRARAAGSSLLLPSIAVVVAAAILGFSFVQGRRAAGTVSVVGSATVPFTSDVVKWRVTLLRQVSLGGEVAGYARLAEDRDRFLSTLGGGGVPAADASVQPVTTGGVWDRDGQQTGVQLRQSFLVVSRDVDAVERLALDPGDLIRDGLGLENSNLEYFYDAIAELKRSLLRQAREDAQARAEEIAGDALGDIMSARAGVFQIREPYSTEVQGYGVYSTSTRAKEMTVTVHATFGLR
jgi:hypothetical protein